MDFTIAGYPMSLPDYDDYTNSKYLSNILDIIEFPNNNQNEALQLNIGNVGDNTDGDASGNTNEFNIVIETTGMEIISLNSFVKNGLQIIYTVIKLLKRFLKEKYKRSRDILSENEILHIKMVHIHINLFRFTMLNKIMGIGRY